MKREKQKKNNCFVNVKKMGVIFSRLNQLNNNNAVEETEIINNYKYPPKSGQKVKKFYFFSIQ